MGKAMASSRVPRLLPHGQQLVTSPLPQSRTLPTQGLLFQGSTCRWVVPSADASTRKGAAPQQMEMAHRWPVPRR